MLVSSDVHSYGIVAGSKLYPSYTNNFQSLFVQYETSDERFKPIGILHSQPTGWMMGKSHQNSCFNVHVSGCIYTSNDFTHQSAPKSLQPIWRSSRLSRTFTYLDEEPYSLSHSVLAYSDLNKDPYGNLVPDTLYVIYLWIPDGNYFLSIMLTMWQNWEQDKTITTADYYVYRNINGTPGRDAKTTKDYPSTKMRLSITVHGINGGYTVHYMPKVEDLDSMRIGSRPARWYHIDANLVPPPSDGAGSYDIRYRNGRVYNLDAAFASGLDQVDFTTSNGIAYALDAKDIISSAKSDLESLRHLAKGTPGKLKIAASLFLSVHYGWKLMASDTFKFAEALDEFSKSSKRRVHCRSSVECNVRHRGGFTLEEGMAYRNVYYDPYRQIANKTFALAEAMDAVPDFSNVWDMIPFSFVVDWFTNIGDLAEGIDAFYTLCQQHKVLGTIDSEKEIYTYHHAEGPGTYTYKIYTRRCLPDWYPVPEFSFQFKNPFTNLTHWCEAGALVVATRP